MERIRKPIISVAGHVDHGKTSLLDRIRGTSVQETEAGGITQKISFTILPKEEIKKRAGEVLEKYNIPLNLPGFLFIDTPGHAAFTNLRKRGGALADIAILVIDISEGIKPQTAEVIQILKANKTPFIIALNKIDKIAGWKTHESGFFFESIKSQGILTKQEFEEKLYTLIGSLQSFGFDSELYMNVKDFTKQVALIPCSAKTGEGVAEIIAMLCGLCQKFLKQRISLSKTGKGVVLEIKKEPSGTQLESILYDGELKTGDEIIISSFDEPVITSIRSLHEALPLGKGFEFKKKVEAAAGLRMQITSKEEIYAGMPFQVVEGNLDSLKEQFKKEITNDLKTDKKGILVKADSLGSLEALMVLLKQHQINVAKFGIGNITKKDIYTANTFDELNKVILGFNVGLADDAPVEELKKIKIIANPVIYKLLEDFEEWRMQKIAEIERAKLSSLKRVGKIRVLDFIFRNSNPAVFGVRVEAGKIGQGDTLVDENLKKIGHIKSIQKDKNSIHEASAGDEVAISMPGVNFDRQLSVGEALYTNLAESEFREFKKHKDLLSQEEKKLLQEIAGLHRRENPTWGI